MGISKRSFFTRNTKRLVSALLSILISGLKFTVNMLTLGISFLTKKSLPLVDDLFESKSDEFYPSDDERTEAIERSKYVVEHSPYDSTIKY